MKTMVRRFGVVGAVTLLVMAALGPAFAVTDSVTTAFSDAQTSLLGYIVAGIAVIVAILLAGLGVGLLVKYLRKAVRAS